MIKVNDKNEVAINAKNNNLLLTPQASQYNSEEIKSRHSKTEDRKSYKENSNVFKPADSDQVSKDKNENLSQLHSQKLAVENQKNDENLFSEQDLDIFDQEPEQKKKVQQFPFLVQFLESNAFQILINILTLFALFGDDIRVALFEVYADIYFDSINFFCLICFTLEIILTVLIKEDYKFSFFFWLDLISTVSLIFDLQMFNQATGLNGSVGNAKNTASLARAGRASRVGTRAGRIVRLVRLIRIVKLYKSTQKTKFSNQDTTSQTPSMKIHPKSLKSSFIMDRQNSMIGEDDLDYQDQEFKESRVSKRLSALTTKRVIILVLLLLLVTPLFSADYYYDPPYSLNFGILAIQTVSMVSNSTRSQINDTINQVLSIHQAMDTPICLLKIPFSFMDDYVSNDYDPLRFDEKLFFNYPFDLNSFKQLHLGQADEMDFASLDELSQNDWEFVGITNIRSLAIKRAIISIFKTVFVCMVLTFGGLMFSKDANDLALRPIERMIQKVNKIAKNPIKATEEQLINNESDQHETILIENAIIKIGTLLALGFGDAGSEIIAANMAKSGDVDPMLPGKKKCAIYGFCDIRNFTDATEVLQEDVMIFVNNIAEIVHSMVDRFQGAANKNIGDAFLLVWKMNAKMYSILEDGTIEWKSTKYMNNLADCALISFLKIQAKINREPKILAYRYDQRLCARIQNYKVKMGFGLHFGWGIEGAIGSEYKIDASYLSPNVNMASRLEAATKQYGVPLLISNELQQYFSKGVCEFTRIIDRTTVKGSIKPIELYTVDLNCENLTPSKDSNAYINFSKQQKKSIMKGKKLFIEELIANDEFDGKEFMVENKDIRMMTQGRNLQFYLTFAEGIQQYFEGNWKEAMRLLKEAQQLKSDDGPCETILNFMQESKFQAPPGWKGYRALLDK